MNPQGLSDNEIMANLLVIYVAGYDTTSITLATIAHNLVNFPEIQEKVRLEVQELYRSKGGLELSGSDSKLQYLDCVIKETLRLYPISVSLISRQSLLDYKYEDITIPNASTVIIAKNTLHFDPEYWANPESFDPTRLLPDKSNEIIPFSYQAFGEGPRKCIEIRLALLEIKLAFAKLLLRYRLEKGPNIEIGKLERYLGMATLIPKNGVFIKAVNI